MVRLSGEADVTTHALRDTLGTEVAKRPQLLLVEMSGLSFMDSSALSVIIRAHRDLGGNDGKLVLVSPSAAVARVLSLVGADQVIRVYGSVDEAVAAAVDEGTG
jgi:anti-anti-sigma factor